MKKGRDESPPLVTICAADSFLQSVCTTVPMPTWPGFGAYPGCVDTMTISLTLPKMLEPVFVTWLVTTTAM